MGIMNLKEKRSLSEDTSENKKCCTDCKTTRTPLWRGGPAGPKSLCNACGIRYRRKRRAIMGLNKGPEKKRERSKPNSTITINKNASSSDTANSVAYKGNGNANGLSESLKVRLMALGDEVLLQRSLSSSPVVVKKQRCQRRRKLKEEEQAAFSLMALSCGSVFA